MKKLLCLIVLTSLSMAIQAESVCYSADADKAVEFAAKDMARCLSIVSGKKYTANVLNTAAAGDVVLAIDKSLTDQQWRIANRSGKLYIEGRDSVGIVYGIYTFLEKYASCSWFAPDTEIVTPQKNWQFPAVNEVGKPVFARREMFVGNDFMDGLWRLRNKENFRANYINYSYGSPRDCHSFDVYVKAIKDPALFGPAKNGGKSHTLCMTNPEVRRIVLEEMLKYIAKDRSRPKPDYAYPRIYDLSQPDGGSGGECWCDSCRKLAEAEGSYSGPNLDFTNYIAREVAKKYPDVLISTFAYSYTVEPPKTIKAEKNVVIRYCAGWVFDPLLLPGTKYAKLLEEWGKHADNLSIWSYWRTYQGVMFPQVKKREHIAEEIRLCLKNNVTFYYAEAEQPLSRSFSMMQHYLMLKMLEDPSRDIYALSEKFIAGYYGKAAPKISEYLNYLEKRQDGNRQFLDKDFYETVNRLLDKAEELVKDDPRSLLHVQWERNIVDRSMYDNLAKLQKQNYKPDMKKIAERFAHNSQAVINAWDVLNRNKQIKASKLRQVKLESELYQYFPVETPARFAGCEVVDIHWSQIKLTTWGKAPGYIKDPDAVCGTAFYNQNLTPKIPFGLGYYNGKIRSGGGISLSAADIPQDGKFHLYKLGNATVMVPLYIHFDDTWRFRYWLPGVGIVPEAWDIWVSMKFTGPKFVPGSKDPNRVLFDRVLLVKDPQPLRKYKPVDSSKNLLKNPGFEKFTAKHIYNWGNVSPNRMIDTTEKHSGKASLKIGNIKDSYVHIQCPIADLKTLNNDLLVRGWYKYQNISPEHLPFIGLWTLTPAGKNGYTKNLASFYTGSYHWQQFEKIIPAEDLKKAVKRGSPDANNLNLRINLVRQPGWVWVDDLEVILLEKK